MPQKATELDRRRFTFAMFPVLAIAATSHALLRPSLPHLSPTLVHSHDRLLALRGGDYTMQQQLISETLGTFGLLLAVRLSSRAPAMMTKHTNFVVLIALGFLICLCGPVSGASFNLSVSWASFITGEMGFNKLILFTIAQLIGAAGATKLVELLP